MGDLVNATHRFLLANPKENLVERITSLSEKYTHFPNELRESIASSVQQILADPSFGNLEPLLLAIDELEPLLQSTGKEQAEAILIDSYLSFCKAEGWDPMDLPVCKRISRFFKHYTFMRQTVCIITLLRVLSDEPANNASLNK